MRKSGELGPGTNTGTSTNEENALVRVGIVVRDLADNVAGGDLVQARAIGRFLREQGCDVELVPGRRLEPNGWDWAILFNVALLPGTALAAEQCRRREVPYVLFPVFWDLPSAIPKEQREAVSRLLPADSARRRALSRAGFALREMNLAELGRAQEC